MAKTNYSFEKRQRDLAKKQKQEEKRRQKLANKAAAAGSGQDSTADQPDALPPDAGSADVASTEGETTPDA